MSNDHSMRPAERSRSQLLAVAVLGVAAIVATFAAVSGSAGEQAVATVSTIGRVNNSVAPPTSDQTGAAGDAGVEAADAADAEPSPAAAESTVVEPEPAAPLVPLGPTLTEAPPILGTEAELTNIDGWLQSDIDSLGDLDGKVHIVQFWTFGCYNCKNTIPNLIHINDTYGGDDFEIVGVHAPEFDFEKDPDSILEAAEGLGVTWPIALDTNKTNFRSWQESRRFWPRTYVIDQEGNIRFDRIGEGAYEKLEATVAWLLTEGADEVALAAE